MIIFLSVYMILMFPMMINVNKELKKQNIIVNGVFSNVFLFINLIITMPIWYCITVKDFFTKKKI